MDTRRHLFNADARIRFADPEKHPRRLTGYALLWNVPSNDRGGYQVRLKPGSARFKTPTLGLYYHSFRDVIATTGNGTLVLTPDQIGVAFQMDVAATTTGNDVIELVRGKFVQGMSFSMAEAPTGRTTTENGVQIFDAESYLVDEVSVVVNPSFIGTFVGPETPPSGFAERARQAVRLQRLRLSQYQLPV